MNYSKATLFYILSILSLIGCAKGGSSDGTPSTPTVVYPPHNSANLAAHLSATGTNVMPVSISGTLCSNNKYTNEPCVKLTLCEPGTSNCQTIDNILLDTGSYGLRVFSSLVSLNLPSVVDGSSKPYGTCATFGSGATWGPVKTSDVILGDLSLGGEKAASVPIQLIDDTYSNYASHCSNGEVDHSPTDAFYNGILGIGLFVQDCGANCVNNTNNGLYYVCTGTACTASRATLAKQVSNPIAYLPVNNNGTILSIPDVSSVGASNASGNLILGIGTQPNNQPDIYATYKGRTTRSLLDSGTNAYAFYDNTIPNCSSSSYYCPTSLLQLTSVQSGTNSVSAQANFYVESPSNLSGSNYVFNNVAFEVSSGQNFFIYGLPFYLGKSIFTGLDGKTSPLGSNLYWAY
jgi:hypothetical protein